MGDWHVTAGPLGAAGFTPFFAMIARYPTALFTDRQAAANSLVQDIGFGVSQQTTASDAGSGLVRFLAHGAVVKAVDDPPRHSNVAVSKRSDFQGGSRIAFDGTPVGRAESDYYP